jgi:hypothetical protein
VTPNATGHEVHAAYIARIKQVHPDHSTGHEEEAKAVNVAYGILSDPQRRAAYDLSRVGAVCPYCQEVIRGDAEAARHLSAHFLAPDACVIRHRVPARNIRSSANAGFILWRQVYSFQGRLCRDCASGAYREFTARNLTRGWWGIISFFATFYYLLANLGQLGEMPKDAPVSAFPPEVVREFRGRPIFRRPSVWVALAIVGCFATLAIVGGANSSSGPSATSTTGGFDPTRIGISTGGGTDGGVGGGGPSSTCDEDSSEQVLLNAAKLYGQVIDEVNTLGPSLTFSTSPGTLLAELDGDIAQLDDLVANGLSLSGRELVHDQRAVLSADEEVINAIVDRDTTAFRTATTDQSSALSAWNNDLLGATALCA